MSGRSRLILALSIIWLLVCTVLYFIVDTSTHVRWGGFFIIGVIPSILLPLIWWVFLGFKDSSADN
jgi:hypothetical protein